MGQTVLRSRAIRAGAARGVAVPGHSKLERTPAAGTAHNARRTGLAEREDGGEDAGATAHTGSWPRGAISKSWRLSRIPGSAEVPRLPFNPPPWLALRTRKLYGLTAR